MARNGSGVYSKPAGTTAVSGELIEASPFNSVIDDIVNDLNLDRPIVAGGTGGSTAAAARSNLGVPHLLAGMTAAPDANDDSADTNGNGVCYVGTVWIDETGDAVYVCADNTATNAVWINVTDSAVQNNYAATTAPTADEDTGDGYAVGSVWIDVTNDRIYFCLDATSTAAVWREAQDTATVAEWRGNTADKSLSTDIVWSAMAEVTLSDGATVAWDMSGGFDFTVTLAGNRTMGNPTNTKVGQKGRLRVVQDGTGSRTLSWSSNFEAAENTFPTLTTTASAEDVLYYDVISSTRILISQGALDIS